MTIRVDLRVWNLAHADEPALLPLLDPDERARADRYHFAQDRAHFIAARGRLRQILAGYAGRTPQSLAFEFGPHGKPELKDRAGLHFNFSDSGTLGALAVSSAGPIGVDIERIRPRDYVKLAERYFSPAELAVLTGLPEADRQAAFFRGWTRKEAFLKAVGTGLSTRLDAFDVSIAADEPPRMLRIDPSIDSDVGAWSLHHFDPADGFMGAVAVRGGGATVEIIVRQAP